MSAYPLVLEGSSIVALVVGGGSVATRKVKALVDSGARVHIVAPRITAELELLAQGDELVNVTHDTYDAKYLVAATLVIAATDDSTLNATIARDARTQRKLVNVVDAPELGSCVTPAVFRNGEIVVAVSTGRVPNAAVRIRDAITATLDVRYVDAVRELASLRRRLLANGSRDRWADAARSLIDDDFCAQVEAGALTDRIGEWR
jgi:siroheme synthase-like protein